MKADVISVLVQDICQHWSDVVRWWLFYLLFCLFVSLFFSFLWRGKENVLFFLKRKIKYSQRCPYSAQDNSRQSEEWEIHGLQVSYDEQRELNCLGQLNLSVIYLFYLELLPALQLSFCMFLYCHFLIKKGKSTVKNKSAE